MKIKQILSYLFVIVMTTAAIDATAQRRTGGKSKTRTSLASRNIGPDKGRRSEKRKL